MDLVIEDYKKRYLVYEIKSVDGAVKPIFPLPHKAFVITPKNLAERLEEIKSLKF